MYKISFKIMNSMIKNLWYKTTDDSLYSNIGLNKNENALKMFNYQDIFGEEQLIMID